MKKTYKKYGIGGIAQSTSSPMIAQGMQASLSAWGGSPYPVFKDGGTIESKGKALVGKKVILFAEGYPFPNEYEITEVTMTPPSYRYRDLFFKVKGSDYPERIKESDIMNFLNGEQVDVYNPQKGEYYAWQLKRGKMALGGYTKRYKSEDMYRIREKKTHERMATEGVGNFELPKDRSTRYLYALDEFDQNLVKDIKLKPNEYIFRYESEATKAGKFNPLVKINLDNQLVYFLTESGYEMDEIEFERKGEKAKFINISDKYRNGGETERGAAHIYIKMQNGKYDVYHGDDVTLQKKSKPLYSRAKVLEGDWDKIWQDIQSTKSGAVEKGAAHIYIMLSDGKYTVYHGDSVTLRKDATPLYSRENAPEGTWKKIWQDLRGAKFGEGGSVSQKVKIKDIPNLHIEESSFFDSADVSYKPQGSNVGRALGRVTNLRKNKYEAVQLVGRGVENKVGEYKTRKEALDSLLNSEIFDGSLSEVVSQLEKENKDEFGGGGVFEVGDWVAEKKGTARGQVYKKLGSFIYLKDKYGNESQTLYSEDKFKKSVKPRYAQGGKIRNQYEGKSASEVWNMLTKEQRQHFLYDHADQIEAYRGEEKGELSSREIIKAYNSDWADLDKDIKNRFDNHVREGEYGGGGKIGFEGLAKKVARRYKGKKVESKYQDEYGKTYDSKEAMEVGRKVAAKVYRQQQGKMADGGFVGDVAGSDLTPTMMGGGMGGAQDAILKKGGQAQVQIENKDIQFNKNLYKGVLDDFDLDGLPNADDPNPLKKQDSRSIEQTKLSTALNNVIRVKDKMDVELDEFVGKLRKVAPNDSKIYGRTKTPYSILNKLVNSRLLDERRGLKDLVGTTVAFNDFSDLEKFKKRVEKGMFGKVTEFDDYYANPNDGYRAYHFIVDQNGTPIELQLKTDRMKQINVLSHDAYKNNALDKDYMLYLTTIANEADKGNKSAQNQYEMIMKDKVSVKKKLSSQ